MKWTKLGQIFDPRQFTLPNGCVEYAQSPQALVLPDRLRIFFSTRARDGTGKVLSHVAYADFDESFVVMGVATAPVLPLGSLGCFDEHGVFPLNVTRDGAAGRGGAVRGYIGGWSRRASVPVDGAIGVAVSHDDGLTFQRLGDGPVLAPCPEEPYMIADPFVLAAEGVHHMWYIFGSAWKRYAEGADPERVYKIGHAMSQDGVTWERRGPGRQVVPDRLGPDECQALPTVLTEAGRHHMLFCYREASGFRTDPTRAYRIGYAVSDDLAHWRRDDAAAGIDVRPGAWDADMLCYPHMFRWRDTAYLLYNGNEFGRYGFGLARLAEV